jgi:hypothetical protein
LLTLFGQRKMTRKNKSIVAAIILILTTIVVLPVIQLLFRINAKNNRIIAYLDIRSIRLALFNYYEDFNHFPTGSADAILESLKGKNPKKKNFFISRGNSEVGSIDPWGERYLLLPTAEDELPEFYSTGPNKIDEKCLPTSDDISTWRRTK